ncbi:MAG: putative NEK/NEK2 protein kinase [Streblomastix strix]|uniref:non-specific serine/threonine protein kinase n=1 Tax=Streblomastix strix TaxID=222440 RepID=A0A5J4WXW0_9EUKA|nr:MAG: putative NEK/NEK2 protein kinase [Streblomastix strix]
MATPLQTLFGEWPEESLQIVDGNHSIKAKLFQSFFIMMNDHERLTPHTYEDYEIIDDLTTGAFGRVYVVRLKALSNKLWIMKRLRYLKDKDKRIADQEVEMLKLAGSKYTVKYVESFTFDVDLCIVMEYCEGGHLRELIKKMETQSVKQRKEQCYNIFYQVLMVLKHLHSLRIVHRDLKPENIFLDQDGNAKTGDFGLALMIQSRSEVNAAGTQNYQPPEAIDFNQMTEASDIWALGVIVVEIFTGVHPFQGPTQDETVANINNGRFKAVPDYVKGELKEMLISMINVDPVKRPSAEELLDSDLMQLLAKIENEKDQNQIAIEEKLKSEEELKKLNELIKQIRLPDEFLKKLREDLMKPLEGTEIQKKEALQLLENNCKFLSLALNDRKDDDGRKRVIKSGVIEGFINVFENYELNSITRTFSNTFFDLTFNSTDEVKLLIYNKKPYPGLIRLLKHSDILIVKRATDSIVNILNSVPDTTPHSEPHPHFEAIQECDGVNKIFELFHRADASKDNKDTAMICLGHIFRALEITDENMRHEIISHLKTLINDPDIWTKNNAKLRLKGLSINASNLSEILNEQELKRVEQDLKQPIEGTQEQQKDVTQRQETDVLLLSSVIEGRNDNELRKRIISSGIVESLLTIFTTRDLNSITETYSSAFFQLTHPSNVEIKLLLLQKKPYPGLIRLLEHTDNHIPGYAIASIFNIQLSGSNTTSQSDPHPHYETIQESDGIKKMFALFQKNGCKYSRDRSALCIGFIFRAREISDPIMRQEIINNLKSLLNDSDAWVKGRAKNALKYLSLNAVNKTYIEAGGFTIPK